MNRRGFLGSLATFAAALTLDPEKLLWRPEAKTIFLPTTSPLSYGWTMVQGPAWDRLSQAELYSSIMPPDDELTMLKAKGGIYMYTRVRGNVESGDIVLWDDPYTVRPFRRDEVADLSRVAGVMV